MNAAIHVVGYQMVLPLVEFGKLNNDIHHANSAKNSTTIIKLNYFVVDA